MKIKYFCYWFFLISTSIFSQEIPNNYISLQERFVVLRDDIENSKIEGSQFFEEDYVLGEVLENGKKIIDAYLRYNAVKEQIEIKVDKDDEDILVLPRLNAYTYDFGEYQYILKNFSTKEGKVLLGYSIVYHQSDKFLFLSKPFVDVRNEVRAETSYGITRPARYLIRNKYYFGINGQPLEEVKIKEQAFETLLENSKGLSDYFDKHKVRDVQDVINLLEFYENSES